MFGALLLLVFVHVFVFSPIFRYLVWALKRPPMYQIYVYETCHTRETVVKLKWWVGSLLLRTVYYYFRVFFLSIRDFYFFSMHFCLKVPNMVCFDEYYFYFFFFFVFWVCNGNWKRVMNGFWSELVRYSISLELDECLFFFVSNWLPMLTQVYSYRAYPHKVYKQQQQQPEYIHFSIEKDAQAKLPRIAWKFTWVSSGIVGFVEIGALFRSISCSWTLPWFERWNSHRIAKWLFLLNIFYFDSALVCVCVGACE